MIIKSVYFDSYGLTNPSAVSSLPDFAVIRTIGTSASRQRYHGGINENIYIEANAKGIHVSFFALRALSSAYPSMTTQETMPQLTFVSRSQNDAPGIMTSDRTRSGLFSATASRASFPLLTPITSAIVRACNKSPKSKLDAYRCSTVSIYGRKKGQRGRP